MQCNGQAMHILIRSKQAMRGCRQIAILPANQSSSDSVSSIRTDHSADGPNSAFTCISRPGLGKSLSWRLPKQVHTNCPRAKLLATGHGILSRCPSRLPVIVVPYVSPILTKWHCLGQTCLTFQPVLASGKSTWTSERQSVSQEAASSSNCLSPWGG